MHQAWNSSSWLRKNRVFLDGHVEPLSTEGSVSLASSLVVEIPWQVRLEDHLRWGTKELDEDSGIEKQKVISPSCFDFWGD